MSLPHPSPIALTAIRRIVQTLAQGYPFLRRALTRGPVILTDTGPNPMFIEPASAVRISAYIVPAVRAAAASTMVPAAKPLTPAQVAHVRLRAWLAAECARGRLGGCALTVDATLPEGLAMGRYFAAQYPSSLLGGRGGAEAEGGDSVGAGEDKDGEDSEQDEMMVAAAACRRNVDSSGSNGGGGAAAAVTPGSSDLGAYTT